jgi:diguanylate cyclase (GGDEF)-like protein
MVLEHPLNILVIDDSRVMRDIISRMLLASKHQVLVADGYVQALKYLSNNTIDLILMDIEMPVINGYELTAMIRDKFDKWVPIIFLSSNDSEEALVKGIDAGGDDYLTKPVNQVILNAKVRAMGRIVCMQSKLDELNVKLERLSNIDPLTNVFNRRALEQKLKEFWQIQQRNNSELSVLMIDIDYFKNFNDHYGHPEGDICLKRVALILKQQINRSTDFVARYGGEEFVILLPFTNQKNAQCKAQSILEAINLEAIKHEYSSVASHVTVSIGIASTEKQKTSDYKELIKSADMALYTSKNKGRQQVSVAN